MNMQSEAKMISETILFNFTDEDQRRRFHATLDGPITMASVRWLPIRTAPKDGSYILVAFRDNSEAATGEFPEQVPQEWVMVVRWRGEDSDAGFAWVPPLDGSGVNVTMAVAWMPLPVVPKIDTQCTAESGVCRDRATTAEDLAAPEMDGLGR
jgi:hypothetical protein